MADLAHAPRERRPRPAPRRRRADARRGHPAERRSSRRCTRRTSWEYLTIALTDVLQGDPEVAFLLADFYFDRVDGEYTRQHDRGVPRLQLHGLSRRHHSRAAGRRRRAARRRGADDRAVLGAAPTPARSGRTRRPACAGPITADGAAPIVVVGTTERSGDAVRVGGLARRSALVGRAHHPRRRGSHRLQQGQRLRRPGRRGVSPRRRRCPRTGCAASSGAAAIAGRFASTPATL